MGEPLALEITDDFNIKSKSNSSFESFLSLLQNTMYFAAKTKKNGITNQRKITSKENSSDVLSSNGLGPAEFISKTGKLYLKVLFICKTWKMKIEKSDHLQPMDVEIELEMENENFS